MPTLSSSHLPQPKNWDEFEEMCADLFSEEWGDPNVTRYGRQGQRQYGVDIYGRPAQNGMAGVQCKGRRHWPPKPLKSGDIDREVAEALKFRPPLTEFIIVTTATDDARIQDHARLISQRHVGRGLFAVHVIGWDEFLRRFTKLSRLVEKHYAYVSNSSILEQVLRTPEVTARLVTEQIASAGIPTLGAEAAALHSTGAVVEELRAALDRDLTARFRRAMQRVHFPEQAHAIDSFRELANEVMQRDRVAASSALRRRILLQASRISAIRGRIDEAQRYFAAGSALMGDDSDRPTRARLSQALGNVDEAIKLLRDERDADAVSTMVSILVQAKAVDVANQFLLDRNIKVADLTGSGVIALCLLKVRQDAIDEFNSMLDDLTEQQLSDSPYLLFLRGVTRLASVFPKPYQSSLVAGVPLEIAFLKPSLSVDQLAPRLDGAIADLERVYPITEELSLKATSRIVRWYEMWCKLLHPYRHTAALGELRASMRTTANVVQFVLLALEFDPEFDSTELDQWLERREAVGGLDEYEFRAALALRMHRNDPKGIGELIAKHRSVSEESLGKPLALVIELKTLMKSGDVASARLLLDEGRSLLEPALIDQLEAEISTAEGADPISEHLRLYESQKSVLALRGLVDALMTKGDHRALGKYAELLHEMTGDPEDIVISAKAFVRAGDTDDFTRLMRQHSYLKDRDTALKREFAWRLVDLGELGAARKMADELAQDESNRDLNLEIGLTIESGHWELLGLPLAAYLRDPAKHDALTLIRAAKLAQSSGYGPYRELMEAAIQKGNNSAEVLLGAYIVAIESGLEDRTPQAREWFERAMQLSGSDGPIQRFELKELLARQLVWRDSAQRINDSIVAGYAPLMIAAPALGTTLVDAVIGNFVRNTAQLDARKRTSVPLYSGTREQLTVGNLKRVALDVTAVLVLGWLGRLPQILELFPEVVIPAGLFHELFEGRSRIRQFQKSRLVRAHHIKGLLSKGLRVHRVSNIQSELAREIGADLASLLTDAELNNGIVVRPAPVLQLGSDGQREADLKAQSSRLSDLHSLLRVLRELGAIDDATEAAAEKYFRLQDRGWPSPARPDREKPLYLDDVAVSYLQTANLLEAVIASFDSVYVGSDVEEEATAIITMDQQSIDILEVIDTIREAIISAEKRGGITFGPRSSHSVINEDRDSSTMSLLANLSEVEGVVFDDRALNKLPVATDRNGHSARTFTSLDLIDELVQRGAITENERRSLRHRLRTAGVALMPVDGGELYAAVMRSVNKESAELRAIRESIALIGLREISIFPQELPWFMYLNGAFRNALTMVWNEQGASDRTEGLADAVLGLQPNPTDWVNGWDGSPPSGWVDAVSRVMIASLAFPVELSDQTVVRRYHRWLDSRVLEQLRENDVDRYRRVIQQIRDFILATTQVPVDG